MINILKRKAPRNLLLGFTVLVLTVLPLFLYRGAEFTGTDTKSAEVVAQLSPAYKPWIDVIWEPPGPEVESLLFALQAAVGSGFIGYYFGYKRGKKKQGTLEK